MPCINKEEIVGWYNESINEFLCYECFYKIRDIEKRYYKPVLEDEIRSEDMYICEACGERFEKQ